jgi:hypothetical protein
VLAQCPSSDVAVGSAGRETVIDGVGNGSDGNVATVVGSSTDAMLDGSEVGAVVGSCVTDVEPVVEGGVGAAVAAGAVAVVDASRRPEVGAVVPVVPRAGSCCGTVTGAVLSGV